MSDENKISMPNYILRSMAGAWKLVQANPKSMEYLDLSPDGFWKSFWALIAMTPAFILEIIYGSQAEGPQPTVTKGLYFLLSLPLTAIVMYYFTRFMKIGINYSSMVIAYNWLNALTYNILIIAGLVLNLLLPTSEVSSIILLILGFYFGLYVVWHTLKISLAISGLLAVGVLLFVNIFNSTLQVVLLRIFDQEVFDNLFAAANTLPS